MVSNVKKKACFHQLEENEKSCSISLFSILFLFFCFFVHKKVKNWDKKEKNVTVKISSFSSEFQLLSQKVTFYPINDFIALNLDF